MKKIKSIRMAFRCLGGLLFAFSVLLSGCSEKFSAENGEGLLRLTFDGEYRMLTRSGITLPDTCDFRLLIRHSDGDVIYSGRYGDAPETIKVKAGSCTVSVVSAEFQKPSFDLPQFGDEQCVVVPADGLVTARLVCRQMNCGMRLRIDRMFLEKFPASVLFLKSSGGRLMYGYSEKRYAYFSPGPVSLIMSSGDNEEVLLTRTLLSGEMLSVGVTVSDSGGSSSGDSRPQYGGRGISLSLDTTRIWSQTSCVIGGKPGEGSGGGSQETGPANVLTINEAKSHIGDTDVWVCAYIVGGNLTSAAAKYDPPFTSRSNLLIGPRSVIVDRSSGMSVQLSAGKVRDALNLVDNPSLLGRKVFLKGDIVEAYFGLTGLKNVSDYRIQ